MAFFDTSNNNKIAYSAYKSNVFYVLEARTGRAVQYINDVILKQENGDQPNVTNIITIITVRTAEDEDLLIKELEKLKRHDTLVSSIKLLVIVLSCIREAEFKHLQTNSILT